MAGGPSYTKFSRLSRAKASEYSLVSSYKLGYRNREDITNLPAGVLIVGSQNVLHNASNRIQIRQGYSVDGATSVVAAAILGSHDFNTFSGFERNLRSGFLTSAGNDGKLQYRYVDASGNVSWRDLMTGLGNTLLRFTDFWKTAESKLVTLFVNGTPNIYEWNGAITTVLSTSNNSTGGLQTLNPITLGGSGYSIGDILTLPTGTNGKVIVNGILGGAIISVGIAAGGGGGGNYALNDTVSVTSFGLGAVLKVTGVSGGAVTSLSVVSNGYGYVNSTNSFTSAITGTGNGLRVTTTVADGSISNVSIYNAGSGYTATAYTPTGGTGSGASISVATVSTNGNTITKAGITTWAQDGFYQVANKQIVINGHVYGYTGGENSNTLTGVSTDPTGETVGSIVHQQVITTPNSAITGLPINFSNHLISTKANSVYIGGDNDVRVFGSKVNTYTDFTFTTPVRLVGEGLTIYCDDVPTALIVQEDKMYISAGKKYWYTLTSTLSSDLLKETITVTPLKTTSQQAAISQEYTSHRKNDVVFISNEPTMDTLGRVEQILGTPQTANISDPIKLDFDAYDFDDGSTYYHQYFIYVAIPKEGLVRIFNLTTGTWEAPQTLPISRFYEVDGALYGHSYNSSESYKLSDGYADRVYPGFTGFPIDAKWVFSYEQFGSRSVYKRASALYVEGYINANTTITCRVTRELDGCASESVLYLDGSDTQIVCIPIVEGSLGKESLGKDKLGGSESSSLTGLPPKVRAEATYSNINFFECSISFEVLGVNNRFELLAFGLNNGFASEEPTNIRV